ncbi:MAG: hypothetical protein M1457_13590 [bacterium]|nr:hypothetical protein [bacterium]
MQPPASPHAPGLPFLPRFFGLKWRLANNHLSEVRRHLWVHVAVGLLVVFLLIGGGAMVFKLVFTFLMRQEPFGPPLMDRLIRMVLLAFFSMLVFSNLIIMLTTTYISREVEFLMGLPVAHRSLYFAKLSESIVYSSWAFVILAIPFFAALGQSRGLGLSFYLGSLALVAPYLVIPAAIGAVAALVLTVWFPPRRMVRLTAALLLVGAVLAAFLQRIYNVRGILGGGAGARELPQLMRFMGIGDALFLPSGWLGRGLLALERHEWGEASFWGLALWSTAAMGLVVCDWLAGPFYYRGWSQTRAGGAQRRARREGAGGLYGAIDALLGWLPRATRAMVAKDMAVFWRDPAQWSQLMILFGLLFIYILNLRSAAGMGGIRLFIPFWQTMISLFNIGATAFVLSILTTRFVYPMLSLEGRQQWVIGLAPIPRTRLIWVKLVVCSVSSAALILPLTILSCLMLRTGPPVTALAVTTVVLMALGLNSLALGLGALLPNFNEDNPSRIANGLGGTLNAIISLVYIGVTLAVEIPWIHLSVNEGMATGERWRWAIWIAAPLWLALHGVMIAVPLWLGCRHWRRIEF